MRGMRIAICVLALALPAACAAEGAGRASVIGSDPSAAPTASVEPTASTAPEGRELSAYYGGDIAEAAQALGGMTFESGEEFSESYLNDALALRGNDGKVTFIELRAGAGEETLCGVRRGMSREEVLALMEGRSMLWNYDEELAWIIHADPEDRLRDETLVVFFDEAGAVRGAWYRAAMA